MILEVEQFVLDKVLGGSRSKAHVGKNQTTDNAQRGPFHMLSGTKVSGKVRVVIELDLFKIHPTKATMMVVICHQF